MVIEMHNLGIEFSLVLEKQKSNVQFQGNMFAGLRFRCSSFFEKFNNGPLKALSPFSYFYWKKIIDRIIFYRSHAYKNLTAIYDEESFDHVLRKIDVKCFDKINSSETHEYLQTSKFDIGVLGGVCILSEGVINCFRKYCLNAHPAPLPQCRGGGALENTLYQGLKPSVSIHIVTPEIDGGDILKVVPIKLDPNDNFFTVGLKLCVQCHRVLATVVADILSGKNLEKISNDGKLYYWKECNIDVQKKAEKNLKRLLAELSSK
jgi:folate-dependent phosphoribosylglycinamide formyltransferase PurN